MDYIFNKLVDYIYADKDIDVEQKEIVRYGLELIYMKAVFLASAILLGILVGELAECILFLLCFIPLRQLAGGYHAKSRLGCALKSMLMVLGVLMCIKLVRPLHSLANVGLVVIGICMAIIIWFKAPQDTENNRLNHVEYAIIKKRVKIMLIVELAIMLLAYWLAWNSIFYAITFAISASAALLLMAEHCKKT